MEFNKHMSLLDWFTCLLLIGSCFDHNLVHALAFYWSSCQLICHIINFEFRTNNLKKDLPPRYFHLKIFVHSPSFLSTSSYANLATKALLKSAHLLNPKPSSAFGQQIESHELRKQAWDFDSLTPHQNLQNKESTLEVTDVARIKDDIIYEGIEEATNLISVVLPACESVFIF